MMSFEEAHKDGREREAGKKERADVW